jgi:hypothetical protein
VRFYRRRDRGLKDRTKSRFEWVLQFQYCKSVAKACQKRRRDFVHVRRWLVLNYSSPQFHQEQESQPEGEERLAEKNEIIEFCMSQ